jgi:hypothetical protein
LGIDVNRSFFKEFTAGRFNQIFAVPVHMASGQGIVEWFSRHFPYQAGLLVHDAGLGSLSLDHGHLQQVALNGEGHDIDRYMEVGREVGSCGLCGVFHMYLHKRTFMAYV